ncbi:SAM-dependent methyltransferase [Lipingzhangella halophila]|uniref:SAM-dependent methyltransferase n=1 Tax=Lipingzhangella halophila TaxID=1783352 RepID=A0A7W7W537_9ACTN|nr:class I SAM-dependent methyltransferase [Lipingzhangella halophila]MBB4934430.1 SAM-dependent methyltransferase [Lipingzhangella halophila]MBB4934842.1 SAM-dependent methyltransferase [Lipingzhangella halophila]
MNAPAEVVVDSYRDRAAWARAECRPTTPYLLAQALDGIAHVVEFPCGTGHFLPAYARAGVRVQLIDASWPMLSVATQHARDAGVSELAVGCHFLHQLPALPQAELVVVPHGALNQLAAQTPLTDVLAHLREAVRPGTQLLLQHLASDEGPGGSFYTPALADGEPIRDHRFRAPHGQEVLRHRRQHHSPNRARVHIEFTYTTGGQEDRTAHVHLALPTAVDVEDAVIHAGWTTTHTHAGSGLREFLAIAGSR